MKLKIKRYQVRYTDLRQNSSGEIDLDFGPQSRFETIEERRPCFQPYKTNMTKTGNCPKLIECEYISGNRKKARK